MSPVAQVSSSDFRQHFGRYMELVEHQDFEITRNGKVVALWTNPHRNRLNLVEELAGSIHAIVDEDADRAERVGRL